MGKKRKHMKFIESDLPLGSRDRKQRDPIHGNIYHIKLLMFFLYGGIKNKYPFRLGAEIDEASKFDDLMFEYTERDGKQERGRKMFRLLQAKHVLDETKKINADHLLTESDGHFSLTKYFFSYQDLKKEELFREGTIKDVIICTNINFDFEDLKRKGIGIEKIKEEDKILDINCRSNNKQSVRYKFCENVVSLLRPKLKNYHLTKLATELVDRMLEKKTIPHYEEKLIFSKYHHALAEEVINIESKKFQDNFIRDVNLSRTATRFKGIFETELKKKTNEILSLNNLNEAFTDESILGKKLSLQLSKKFGEGNNLIEVWPQNNISNDDINDFLNHLVFAVNQPNEEELSNALQDKIGSRYNYIAKKNLYKDIFHKMLDLLQGKKKNRFFTHEEGEEIFELAINEIYSYPAIQYQKELDDVTSERNVHFKERDDFQKFISSDKDLWILHSETPWLTSLVVYQELIRSHQTLKYFFVPTSSLDKMCHYTDVELWLVINSLTENTESVKTENTFRTFLKKNSGPNQITKRFIYITPNRDDLAETSTLNNVYKDEEFRIGFSDMTDESQILVAKEEKIRLQGNVRKQSIKQLLQLDEQLFQRQIDTLNLDSSDLEILLTNQQIDIWKYRPRFSDLESVHYKPRMRLKIKHVKEAIERNPKDIFAFVGEKNQVKQILPSGSSLLEFKEIIPLFPETMHRFIFLDGQKSAEQFKELCGRAVEQNHEAICGENSPVLHLLESRGNEWIWAQSYSRSIYVQRHFHLDFGMECLRDFVLQIHYETLIIISGFNPETLSKKLEISESFLKRKQNLFISLSHKKAEDVFNLHKEGCSFKSFKFVSWCKVNAGDPYVEDSYFHKSVGKVHKRSILLKRVWSKEDLVTFEQVIVLAGEAGIGKSVTLAHIAEAVKNLEPSSLVVKVEFVKFQDFFTSKSCSTISDVIDLLLDFVNDEKNSFTKKIFSYMLLYTNKVKIFWDGFDDVSPDKQDHILNLFKIIKTKTLASMWISTRREYQKKLEEELSVLAYNFSRGNENFQATILAKFLDIALKFSYKSTENFRTVLEKQIMQCFDSKRDNEENIMSIPLIMRMVAEMQLEKIRSTTDIDQFMISSSAENNLLIDEICSSIVDKKYNIFLYEKSNIGVRLPTDSVSALKRQYSTAYHRLALKTICREFNFTIDCIQQKEEGINTDTLKKIGLVEGQGDSVNFIHRSFLEYFVTDKIISKLSSKPVTSPASKELWDVLLNKILICFYSRRFFDDKLLRGNAIEDLLTNTVQKDIIFSLILEKSSYIVLIFWLSALDGLERTLKVLLKSAKDIDSLKQISDIVHKVEIFSNYTPYMLLAKTILNYGNDLDATKVHELITRNTPDILYRAVLEDDLQGVGVVIRCVRDTNKIVELITPSTSHDNYGKTALHVAFENSNIKIVEQCIEKLSDTERRRIFNMSDFFNDLPLDKGTRAVREDSNVLYQKHIDSSTLDAKDVEDTQRKSSILMEHIQYTDSKIKFKFLYLERYLPAFEEGKTSFRGAIISRFFSQLLFLMDLDCLLKLMIYVQKFYSSSSKLESSNPGQKIDYSSVSLFAHFICELHSTDKILPSRFVIHRAYKSFDCLRSYVVEEIGDTADFAILLGASNHVLTICRKDCHYVYFDFSVGTIFNLKHINDALNILEKALEIYSFQECESCFLVEHFDIRRANYFLERNTKIANKFLRKLFSFISDFKAQEEA